MLKEIVKDKLYANDEYIFYKLPNEDGWAQIKVIFTYEVVTDNKPKTGKL